MMALIFATLTVSLGASLYGPRWFAVATVLICLLLSTGLFLFEIHSPEDGFGMPWLQVEADGPARGASA